MNFLDIFAKPDLIAAHRGNRSMRPENTLAALHSSIGKCDFIEIDVQLSKDNVPVIMHDDTLYRTTDVRDIEDFAERYPWRVRDFTFEELQRLDFGSWFYKKDPFGQIKAGKVKLPASGFEPLLTLEKALIFAKEHQIFLNVEIKDMQTDFADREVVKTVIGLIQSLHAEPFVLLSSFKHDYLPLCKALAPGIPTAALQENQHPDDLIVYLGSLSVNAYHPDEKILDKSTVVKLRKAGYFVGVFTVNDPIRSLELFEWGVNAVFTDFPNNIE